MLYFLFPLGTLSVGTSSWGGLSSEVEGDRVLTGYEAPWRGERDRGRRPQQYICPWENRKTSERFRTQPITSAERQDTDRYCSGLMHGCKWRMQENIHMIMHVKEIITECWSLLDLMQRNVDSNQDLVHYTDESSSMSSLVHSKLLVYHRPMGMTYTQTHTHRQIYTYFLLDFLTTLANREA